MSTIEPILKRSSRIAVVGAGVSGLGAAWALRGLHQVTLYEKDSRLGGHANTAVVDHAGQETAVDTGFIVFNRLNYPNLTALFAHLGIETHRTDMSFGFSLDGECEWSSNGLGGLFAQASNLFRPSFVGMLRDVLRFNKRSISDLEAGILTGLSLGQYLDLYAFGTAFREQYLLPMGAAIWSASESDMADYPAEAFVRFFRNHRLVNASRPKWETVVGGSQTYVRALWRDMEASGVQRRSGAVSVTRLRSGGVQILDADGNAERYDEVILACHSSEALALLSDADADEREMLGAIPYSANIAILHRDESFLPRRKGARAAWCYMRDGKSGEAAVTYDMNRLQHIDPAEPMLVTLNPKREPDPTKVLGRYSYDHPQFTPAGLAAQRIFNRVQGVRNTWFAGAWLGYGFHEDGLRSGLRVALRLGGAIPWTFADGDITGGEWGDRDAARLQDAPAMLAE
ncbi:MAG: NAD(P)/FAD-dependent oxidoreductase [Caulobacterales bacterium]|uniref:NAD(P)/FAD-dependent oxidoreductase n=1 Tax=Glycocaulis sp. TaxID=1969725 RepID=UPI003F9F2876